MIKTQNSETLLERDRTSVHRSWVVWGMLGWFLILGLLILFSPHYASVLLREYKARVDVHFIYGSTAGKALWSPFFILFSFVLINLGAKLVGRESRSAKLLPIVLGSLIIVVSLLLWFKSFAVVVDTLREYKVDPYVEGVHFQTCKDACWYNEFINPEHVHAFKVVAHKLLLRDKFYITGEDFTAIHDFDITLPTIGILCSLLAYLASLLFLSRFSVASSFAYVLGYYIVFFSYFDGGLLAGFQGLFLMCLTPAFSARPNHIGRYIITLLGLFALAYAVQVGLQYAFHLLAQFPIHPTVTWQYIWYYTGSATLSRLLVFLLLMTAAIGRSSPLRWFLAAICLVIYATNFWLWHHIVPYMRPLEPGKPVIVRLNSDTFVSGARPLVKFKNSQVFLYPVDKKQSQWDFCRELLSKAEGLSYRSLMVNIYCEVIKQPAMIKDTWSRNEYKILSRGKCGGEHDSELKDYFEVSSAGEGRGVLSGIPLIRAYGVPFCLDNITGLVSRKASGIEDPSGS